jgi:hypothetical protein
LLNFLEPGRERKDLADQRRLKTVQYLAQRCQGFQLLQTWTDRAKAGTAVRSGPDNLGPRRPGRNGNFALLWIGPSVACGMRPETNCKSPDNCLKNDQKLATNHSETVNFG